jgi:hypothetical protein
MTSKGLPNGSTGAERWELGNTTQILMKTIDGIAIFFSLESA